MDSTLSSTPLDRLAEADAIFDDALTRPADERTAFLRARCGDDEVMYRLVSSLLESDGRSERALGESATEFAATLLESIRRQENELLEPGAQIGAYRIVGLLGRGGMGIVYRSARADGTFEKEVALKLVKRGMDTDEVLRRFRRERRILATLEHPGIARILDAGAAPDGRPYLVMECVDGRPITTWADEHDLPINARLDLFERVCEAVTYAHRHLVVHRDLKPSNILVAKDGDVKLLDFGIARLLEERPDTTAPLTRPGFRILTPEYSAPEQLRSEPATTATDVYSLGVVLHELLVGHRPGHRPGESAGGRPLRGDTETLVRTALHEDPARRYASAEALLDDLRRLRRGLPLAARPDSAGYRASKFIRRHPIGVVAAVAAIAALIAFTAVLLVQRRATERERDRAEVARARAEQTASFLEGLFDAADPFAPERLDTLNAGELLDRGEVAISRDLGGQPVVQADLLASIGRARMNLGLYDEAESAVRRALAIADTAAGDSRDHDAGNNDALERANLQSLLVSVLYARADPADGGELVQLSREVVATRRAQLDSDDPQIAAALNDLALVLKQAGERDETEAAFREAIAIHRAAANPDTLELATALKNLADFLLEVGEYDEAERFLAESIVLRRAVLSSSHPSVAIGLQSIATLERDRGRFVEAEAPVREALEINRSVLGADHPHVADNLGLLGSVLRGQGRLDEAATALNEAVARTRAFRGDRHPDLAVVLNTYSGLLIAQEKYDDAASVLKEAISIVRNALGDDHPAVAFNESRLALVRHLQGDHAASAAGYRETLRIFEGYYGPATRNVAMTQGSLAICLSNTGRSDEARALLETAVATLTNLYGPDHKNTTWAKDLLAGL